MPLTVRAPAKINLHLRVFPSGGDGFHPLRSWFRTIDLFDELSLPTAAELGADSLDAVEMALALDDGGLEVRLSCSDPTIACDEENLVVRAVHAILGRGRTPLALHLEKRIPAGAGLGGGSSDAAAALALIEQLRPSGVPYDVLAQAAFRLGADVPFFLRHQLDGITDATCTGRGEIVQPFQPARRHAVLLLLTGIPISTPAVYRRFDELPAPPDDGTPDFAEWSQLDARALLPKLRNDLEPAAFSLHPELKELRASAEARLGRPVRMTGSGGALFTLYDPGCAPSQEEAADRLRDLPVEALPA